MKITLEFDSPEELRSFLLDPESTLLPDSDDAATSPSLSVVTPPPQAAAPAAPQRGRGRPKNPPAAPANGVPAQTGPAVSSAPSAPGAPTAMTLDQVRGVLMELRNHDGNPDAARALVKQFAGVDQVADIPADKFAAVYAGGQQLMAERRAKANGGAAAPSQSFEI